MLRTGFSKPLSNLNRRYTPVSKWTPPEHWEASSCLMDDGSRSVAFTRPRARRERSRLSHPLITLASASACEPAHGHLKKLLGRRESCASRPVHQGYALPTHRGK